MLIELSHELDPRAAGQPRGHVAALGRDSNPDRRDLDEVHARAAAAAGVAVVINSDAHGPERLAAVRYGVWTARRAWLSAADVANTLPWEELKGRLKRAR